MCDASSPGFLRWWRLSIRKVKRLLECLAFGLFDTLVLAGRQSCPSSPLVAVVNLELVGDYVLWLPYGKALAQHLCNEGRKVVLVLNAAVAPLARRHFSECMIVAVDRRRFVRDWRERRQVLRILSALNAALTYHISYPRDAIVEDAAVRALGGMAWGFDATFADRPWIDRALSRRLYGRLLPAIEGVHQTRRHRAFLDAVDVPSALLGPVVMSVPGLEIRCESPYMVVAPGASHGQRRWPAEQFIAVVHRILDQHQDWQCLIVGTVAEREIGEQMVARLGERAKNLTGCTDMPALVALIAQARLVLGNDSAAVHIAAASGVPGVAVVGGGHYGRCFPYDPGEAPVRRLPVSVAQHMTCFGCDWICRYRIDAGRPFPCIGAVTVDTVWVGVATALAGTTEAL